MVMETRLRAVTDMLLMNMDFTGDRDARINAAYTLAGRIAHILREDDGPTISAQSWAAFDEWCDALGRAADDDYTEVPYPVLIEWFGRGDSVDVAVGHFLDYRMKNPK